MIVYHVETQVDRSVGLQPPVLLAPLDHPANVSRIPFGQPAHHDLHFRIGILYPYAGAQGSEVSVVEGRQVRRIFFGSLMRVPALPSPVRFIVAFYIRNQPQSDFPLIRLPMRFGLSVNTPRIGGMLTSVPGGTLKSTF